MTDTLDADGHVEEPIEEIELTVVTDGTFANTRLVDNLGRVVKGAVSIEYATDWHSAFKPVDQTTAVVKVMFRSLRMVRLHPEHFQVNPVPPEETPFPPIGHDPGVQSASGAHDTEDDL